MRNADVGELAEARVDSVNDFVALNDLFDRFARSENTRPRSRRNANGLASESDRCELNKGNLIALQFHSRSLVRIPEKEKGQVGTRPGLLGETARIKLGAGFIFRSALEVVLLPPCVARKPPVPKR